MIYELEDIGLSKNLKIFHNIVTNKQSLYSELKFYGSISKNKVNS